MISNLNKGPLAVHKAALAEGKFVLQQSASSGKWTYPPRSLAPGSGADDLEWQELSGRGTVYAVTIVSRRAEKGGDYNIALVELYEGPRLMTRVIDVGPADINIGMPVRARIQSPDFGTQADSREVVVLFVPDHAGEK